MPQARTPMTTSSRAGDGSGTLVSVIRGWRQTWLPRRATCAAASPGSSDARTDGRGSQSASSRSAFTLELPVVRFEPDELQGVSERVHGEEARSARNLPVVVAGRRTGRFEARPQLLDVVDLE